MHTRRQQSHVVGGLGRPELCYAQVRIVLNIQPRRSSFDAAQQQMAHRVEADLAQQ